MNLYPEQVIWKQLSLNPYHQILKFYPKGLTI